MSGEHGGRSEQGRPPPRPGAGEPWGPLDAALAAYRSGLEDAVLVMRTDVAEADRVPVRLFFRGVEEMGPVERTALSEAYGRVLDLGSGPGAHAVPLMRAGLAVTAMEILPEARAALAEAGVLDVRAGGLEALETGERFDTVLVLMNGLGLSGSLAALPDFLERTAAHVAPGGQILADSTDPRAWPETGDGRYPGEVHMQLAFEGGGTAPAVVGPPFPFLFVDPDGLAEASAVVGLTAEVLVREPDGRFLARIRA